MRSVFVDQSLRWVAQQQFGNDEKPDVLLAVKRLLEDVAAIAVCREFHNVASARVVSAES